MSVQQPAYSWRIWLVGVIVLGSNQFSDAWSPVSFLLPSGVKHSNDVEVSRHMVVARQRQRWYPRFAKKKDDDEEDEQQEKGMDAMGMEQAFRQLDALTSLGDGFSSIPMPPKQRSSTIVIPNTDEILSQTNSSSASNESMESEIGVYKELISELDTNDDAEAYRDMMGALDPGDDRKRQKQTDDTYASVMDELGGTPRELRLEENSTPTMPSTVAREELEQYSSERLLDAALKQALEEVKESTTLNNDKDGKRLESLFGSDKDSILDDKEMMKEIEQIMEEGNQKLIDSLEEIRAEQVRSKLVCAPWYLPSYLREL